MSNWIPVIGTLCGAILGFLASLLIAYFNRSIEKDKEKDERDRQRLERIYKLIVYIRRETAIRNEGLIQWIVEASPFDLTDIKGEGMPPLRELEMIIDLYFPSLKMRKNSFMEKIHKFTFTAFEIKSKNIEDINVEDASKLDKAILLIDSEVKDFLAQLSMIIKA